MQTLLKILLRYSNFLVFIVLEVAAFLLLSWNNVYPRSSILSTANNIVAWQNEKISDITDYFVIASGRSTTQVKAIAEEVEFQMEKLGVFANHKEGLSDGRWIALDYTDVIVHIFHEETRTFYQLEKLWNNGSNYESYVEKE